MKTKLDPRIVASFAALLCAASTVYAVLRNHYSDSEVVKRSELIVIAKMKEGSLKAVPGEPFGPANWRDPSSPDYHWPGISYRLELSVSEVIRGTLPTNPITVDVGGGLSALIGRYSSNQFGAVYDHRGSNQPKDIVEIFDTGNSLKTGKPVTGDIRTNHIWLLRSFLVEGPQGATNTTEKLLGIIDQEDIQPVWRLDELSKHLKGEVNK